MESEIPPSQEQNSNIALLFFVLVVVCIGGFVVGSIAQLAYLFLAGHDVLSFGSSIMSAADTRWSLLISQAFIFLVPALFYSWIMFRKRMWSFLAIQEILTGRQLLHIFLIMVMVIPLIQFSYEMNQNIPLPDWMTMLEESTADTLEQILQMDNLWVLFINVFLMALLPAVAEEMLFRGVIQQIGYRIFKATPWISVWVTAIIFSTIHFQFAGFIPRLILGVLLGYLFYWSKNLWVPVAAHFVNNAISVISAYFYPEIIEEIDQAPVSDIPWYGTVGAVVILIPLVTYFKNSYSKITSADLD